MPLTTRLVSLGAALVAVAGLTACDMMQPLPTSRPPSNTSAPPPPPPEPAAGGPSVSELADGQVQVDFPTGCTVVYMSTGTELLSRGNCTSAERFKATQAFDEFKAASA